VLTSRDVNGAETNKTDWYHIYFHIFFTKAETNIETDTETTEINTKLDIAGSGETEYGTDTDEK
jgi:hypothetical protein